MHKIAEFELNAQRNSTKLHYNEYYVGKKAKSKSYMLCVSLYSVGHILAICKCIILLGMNMSALCSELEMLHRNSFIFDGHYKQKTSADELPFSPLYSRLSPSLTMFHMMFVLSLRLAWSFCMQCGCHHQESDLALG